MNIKKQLSDLLKMYLDGVLQREELNTELESLHSKIIGTKRNMVDENSLYISIIYWISRAPSEHAYDDGGIRYVYNSLIGEEGYELRHSYWIPNNKEELNAVEQRILEISRKYISNYENNAPQTVFGDHKFWLEVDDVKFINSLYSDLIERQEFRKGIEIPHIAIYQLLKLLDAGHLRYDSSEFDTNGVAAEKLKHALASYEKNLPVYCVVSMKNGNTTVTII